MTCRVLVTVSTRAGTLKGEKGLRHHKAPHLRPLQGPEDRGRAGQQSSSSSSSTPNEDLYSSAHTARGHRGEKYRIAQRLIIPQTSSSTTPSHPHPSHPSLSLSIAIALALPSATPSTPRLSPDPLPSTPSLAAMDNSTVSDPSAAAASTPNACALDNSFDYFGLRVGGIFIILVSGYSHSPMQPLHASRI